MKATSVQTYSLCLESIDSLDLCRDVVADWLKISENLFRLVHNILILQRVAIVLQIHIGTLALESSKVAPGVFCSLAECLYRSSSVFSQSKAEWTYG